MIPFMGNSLFQHLSINVRDPELRTLLGYPKSKRRFSYNQLKSTPIESMAQPLFQKQEKNSRSLTPDENQILEVFHQFWTAREIISGNNLLYLLSITEALSKSIF